MTKKLTPNTLLVDDSVVDDHSTISLSKAKMEELGLFDGDIVLLKGKKRKNTIAVVNTDKTVDANRARMSKVIRSNLRYIYICMYKHMGTCRHMPSNLSTGFNRKPNHLCTYISVNNFTCICTYILVVFYLFKRYFPVL